MTARVTKRAGCSHHPVPPASLCEEDTALMPSAERPYVQVFYDFAKEYPTVYRDSEAFGAWVRLMMDAQAVWPAPASLPRWVSDAIVEKLKKAGIVTIDGDHYSIKGLDKMRAARRAQAKAAADARWNAASNAEGITDGDASAMPHNSTQLNSTQGSATNEPQRKSDTALVINGSFDAFDSKREGLPNLDRGAINALEERTGQLWSQFGQSQLGEYDRLIGRYGLPAVLEAIDKARGGRTMTARQVIWSAMKILEPFPNVDQKEVVAGEQRAQAESNTRRQVERTQLALHYQHIDGAESHPLCPACRGEVVS